MNAPQTQTKKIGSSLYHERRLVRQMEVHNADLIIAATKENVHYFSGFSPVVKTLNPHLGECFALVRSEMPSVVNMVVSAGESDQLLDMTSVLGDAWIFGQFFRRKSVGSALTAEEERLSNMGPPIAPEAGRALVAALTEYCGTSRPCRVLIDEDGLRPTTRSLITSSLPNVTLVEGSLVLRQVRLIKTEAEIGLLTEAARQNEAALQRCVDLAHPGISETEVVRNFELALSELGSHPGVTMIKLGRHSVTGQRSGNPAHCLKSGDILWFDSDSSYRGYWADIARSVIFGTHTQVQQDRYNALREGMAEGLDKLKPSMVASEIFEIVVSAVRKAGISDYERHHVGHGIGLEPFEAPILAESDFTELEPGMVISLETPFYEYGFGALHIEDPVIITETGAEFLTANPNPHFLCVGDNNNEPEFRSLQHQKQYH